MLQQGVEVQGHWVLIIAGKSSPGNFCRITIKTERSVMDEGEWRGQLTTQKNLGVGSSKIPPVLLGVIKVNGEWSAGDGRAPEHNPANLVYATRRKTALHTIIVVTGSVEQTRECEKSGNDRRSYEKSTVKGKQFIAVHYLKYIKFTAYLTSLRLAQNLKGNLNSSL